MDAESKDYKVPSREERETVLSWDAETKCWHIYTDEPKHARKYEKYIDDSKPTRRGYSESEKLVMLEGDLKGANVTVSKKRVMTAEQKQRLAERARSLSNFVKKHDHDRELEEDENDEATPE